MKKCLTSWGHYPKEWVHDYVPESLGQLESLLTQTIHTPWIPRGLGRSYGDSALSYNIYSSSKLKHFISFDPIAGVLCCQSGVCLAEILAVIVPQGWFLPVTPGTKFVSVGGAIASDVHGKNHHHVGAFSAFVEELELITAEGLRMVCSKTNQPHIFYATCGGMGLTGFIVRATLRLLNIHSDQIQQQIIKTKNLTETLEILSSHAAREYSVAWLDCSAAESELGRALVFLGQHAEAGQVKHFTVAENKKDWPLLHYAAPCFNPYSAKLFNALYYHLHQSKSINVPLNQYFYPLDSISNWNHLYGTSGFTQYQLVLPGTEQKILKNILLAIRDFGACSFLSVLKILGKENANYLSFPMAGLTLALDFKISDRLWPFLDQLDQQVIAAGGRVYLTKDCRLPKAHFQKMYPRWEEFLVVKAELDPCNKIQSLQSMRLFGEK